MYKNEGALITHHKQGSFVSKATGGGLSQIEPNQSTYNGTTSIEISFDVVDSKVTSLTLHEPDLILTARKVEE